MSKKLMVISGVLAVVMVLIVAGVYFWFQYQKERSIALAFETGIEAYEKGEWGLARKNLSYYIAQQRRKIDEDALFDVLLKYSDACSQVTNNRLSGLMEAVSGYKELLLENPKSEEFLNLYLDALERRRYWPLVETETERLKKKWADLARINVLHAASLDRQGKTEAAISAYTLCIESGFATPEVYGRLAFLYWESDSDEELAETLKIFVETRESDPKMAAQEILYYAERIPVLDGAGRDSVPDRTEAALATERALLQFPSDPDVSAAAALAALALGEWAIAAERAGEAARMAPSESQSYLVGVLALEKLATSESDDQLREDRFKQAIAVIEDVDGLVLADSPELHLAKVELLLIVKDLDAVPAARKAYKKTYPDHRSFHDYLKGRELIARGNSLAGVDLLRTVLNARPSFRQAQYHLIGALLSTSRMNEAKVTMEVYQRNYPDDPTIRHLYGQHFGGRDALNDAVALAREADEPNRDLPLDAYVARARRLFLQALRARQLETHLDLVVSLLEKAIAEGPAESVGYDELVRVHLTRGNAALAAEALARADAAGIPDSELLMARAGEALSDGRTEDALGVYERQLSVWGKAPRLDDLVLWAKLFARSAGADAGVRVIDLAKEGGLVTGENAVSLEVEKISMFANSGDLDRALEVLYAVEETINQSSGSMNAIRYRTEGLIPLLVQQDVRSNFQVAEDLVKRLREDYPQEQGYPVLYARLLMSQDPLPDGAEAKAEKLLQNVLRRTPNHVDAMMALSSITRAKGSALPRSKERQLIEEEALGYAQDAAFQNPDNWRAQLLLATIQLERGQPEAAATTLANVVDIYPDDKRLLLALVEAYRAGKNYFGARSVLARIGAPSQLDEDTAKKATLALTRLELDEGKLSGDTVNRLQTRHEENPESLPNALDFARALALQGDVEEGAVLLEGLASDNAQPATVWAALGRYYIQQGEVAYLKDARAAFTKAKIYDPLQPTALKGLIELHLNARNFATALSLSETFLTKVYAEDQYVLYRKSGTLFAMAKPKEALAPINKSIDLVLVPNADYLFLRARIYMMTQEFDAALGDLRVVTDLGVSNATLLDLAKAEAYFGKGDAETAQSFLSSAKSRVDASNSYLITELNRVTALGASL